MSYEESNAYNSQERPESLQMASVALGLHALAWAVHATVNIMNGWGGSWWRVALTFVMTLLISSELLAGKKWAWIAALILMILDLGRNVLSLGALSYLRANRVVAAGELNNLLFAIDILLLVAGLFYLLHRESRRACRVG